MKMRILDDSLRLRLSQGDVAQLASARRVEAHTHFGAGESALVYSLNVDPDIDRPSASFVGAEVKVSIPKAVAEAWIGSAQIGIQASQEAADGRILALLIEKDFKCVVSREGEENYDGFPNPDATC